MPMLDLGQQEIHVSVTGRGRVHLVVRREVEVILGNAKLFERCVDFRVLFKGKTF